MHPEQQIIAQWVQSVMDAKGWNAAQLSRAAKVDATTITRAANPEFKSVTSVKTLDAIARGAEVPSITDFLTGAALGPASASLPSEEVLAGLLAAILPLLPRGQQTAQSLRVVASALRYGLELLGDQTANTNDAATLGVAARGAVVRFRDLLHQSQ